jgi:hypothetical protein
LFARRFVGILETGRANSHWDSRVKLKTYIGKVCHLIANMRAHHRRPHQGAVVISWKHVGEVVSVYGSCRDYSESGIGIVMSEPLRQGKTVYVCSAALKYGRTALVRHCRRRGASFHVGLEFTSDPAFVPVWKFEELELLINGVNW